MYTLTPPLPSLPFQGKGGRGSAPCGGGCCNRYVSVSVGEAADGVGFYPAFVVKGRQTDLRDFTRRHCVFVRSERTEAAADRLPVVENVEILFVTYVLLHVLLRYTFRDGK